MHASELRILVTDPNPDDRRILVELFGELDARRVAEASSGKEGLSLFGAERFDLVITECNLPDRTGTDFIAEICRQRPGTPVVVVSAEQHTNAVVQSVKAGAADFLHKPLADDSRRTLLVTCLDLVCSRGPDRVDEGNRAALTTDPYTDLFVSITQSVFERMTGNKPAHGAPFAIDHFQPPHEVSSVIDVSGAKSGRVVLSLSREVAIDATETMLNERHPELDDMVVSVVGELTNIITAQARSGLEQLELSIGPPQTVKGRTRCIEFPPGSTPTSVPFTCEAGQFSLQFGLT